jgi:hypothetical protein
VRANFTVFRCPSILHGRASEHLPTDINKSLLFAFVRSKSLVIVGFAVTIAVSTANEGVCHHALSRRVDWMTAVNYTTVVDCKWQAIYLVTWYSGGVFGGNKVGDEA